MIIFAISNFRTSDAIGNFEKVSELVTQFTNQFFHHPKDYLQFRIFELLGNFEKVFLDRLKSD